MQGTKGFAARGPFSNLMSDASRRWGKISYDACKGLIRFKDDSLDIAVSPVSSRSLYLSFRHGSPPFALLVTGCRVQRRQTPLLIWDALKRRARAQMLWHSHPHNLRCCHSLLLQCKVCWEREAGHVVAKVPVPKHARMRPTRPQ
jgi:hypothetical protein